jgi:dipeptidyl-peptidase-4
VPSKAETRLTTDGSATILNGALSWVYWEGSASTTRRRATGGRPTPARSRSCRTDETGIDEVGFQQVRDGGSGGRDAALPEGRETGNPVVRLGIANLSTGKTPWMDTGRLRVRPRRPLAAGERAPSRFRRRSSPDPAGSLAGGRAERPGGRHADERDDAWVNQKDFSSPASATSSSAPERDGHTHLYRYGADGRLKNAVTRGPWSVRGPQGFYGAPLDSTWIDPKGEWVFFTARQKPEGERQLYRVRIDGSGLQRITREDGTHAITMSPGPPLLSRRLLLGEHAAVARAPRRRRQDASRCSTGRGRT